jgi:NAD(P)-dependent dehydrogenase (short-subunit alcohol dehydrogenase family)
VGGSSGIGLAAARQLTSAGHQVVITGRDQDKLAAAVKELGDTAGGAAVDAHDEAATQEFFASLGEIDHVVIAATGVTITAPFQGVNKESVLAANGKLVAHVIAVQGALQVLRPAGSITFITAVSAGSAMPGTAAPAAVNGAIEAMVPVLAVELAPIRVNAVSPGVVDTAWWDFLDADTKARTFAGFAAITPVRRVGKPEDIADAITFLVRNTFTTGVVLRVDGGARLTPPSTLPG